MLQTWRATLQADRRFECVRVFDIAGVAPRRVWFRVAGSTPHVGDASFDQINENSILSLGRPAATSKDLFLLNPFRSVAGFCNEQISVTHMIFYFRDCSIFNLNTSRSA